MSSVTLIRASGTPNEHGYSRLPVPVTFTKPQNTDNFSTSLPFKVDFFILANTEYVLVNQLASLWNFPSSYQVITRIVKKTGIPRNEFLYKTSEDLNGSLLIEDAITSQEANKQLFYISLRFLYSIIENKSALVGDEDAVKNTAQRERPVILPNDDDTIAVSQVFPQYGHEEASFPKDHATFLALTPLKKLLVYKHEGNYRRVYGTSLSANERELLVRSNNYTTVSPHVVHPVPDSESSSSRKPLGRSRRQIGSVDPNSLDVSENILPGNGAVPEFLVGPLCKVPNYFVSNGLSATHLSASVNSQKPHLSNLELKFTDSSKATKHALQLLLRNDQEQLHSKYYYFKTYRGPGSGNYKDAALVNRINKIRKFTRESTPSSNAVTHLPPHKIRKALLKRYDRAIKGLIHDFYSPENIEVVLNRQRQFTEDFTNLEMLHSTILFNLLTNSYRELSGNIWSTYYKFRMVDYEKLYLIERAEKKKKRKQELLAEYEKSRADAEAKGMVPPQPTRELTELMKPDLTERFTLPTDHPEIMQKLPLELRGLPDDPETQISRPIRYVATYPDKQLPEVLNQIEVVKLPNANSLAWDNIKKYREN